VVAATRVVGASIAESLASLEPALTMPQWRVLVLANEGDCNVSAVAEDLGVHLSNATRMCDRLVAVGLLERRRAEYDRRHVLLVLTTAGNALFGAPWTIAVNGSKPLWRSCHRRTEPLWPARPPCSSTPPCWHE
jgi:DNA-binding MarR family transcriptional regulator